MAAEMAYRFLFAIFPLMLFLVASLGLLGAEVNALLSPEQRPLWSPSAP